LLAEVDGDDVGALFGEADRMRPALTAGGAGNEDDIALELCCHTGLLSVRPDPPGESRRTSDEVTMWNAKPLATVPVRLAPETVRLSGQGTDGLVQLTYPQHAALL
jgi:hypothetical protein